MKGRWNISGKRTTVYVKKDLPFREQVQKAQSLKAELESETK
jgi:hypothetical protein